MDIEDNAAEFFFGYREDAVGEMNSLLQRRLPSVGALLMNLLFM